jgi:ribose/xylose/arabinose/galactoside ABC-type transport system permease subunit
MKNEITSVSSQKGGLSGKNSWLTVQIGKSFKIPALYMLIIAVVVFSYVNKSFLTFNNIVTLVVMNSFFAIAASGETFVLMTGGIDLSVAQVLALSSITTSLGIISLQKSMPQMPIAIVILIGLVIAVGTGLLFGVLNAVSIGYGNMTPFIATLSTQLVARGISFVLSKGKSIPGVPKEMLRMSYATGIRLSQKMVIPWVIIVTIIIVLIMGVLLGKTIWGRKITLIGSNGKAAKYVGYDVAKITASVYITSGILAGIGGFVAVMCLGAGDPKIGDPLLVTILGSVILGGVNMNGGEGSMSKAVLGMALFSTLFNGMTFLNLSLSSQQIVLGTIIVIGTALISVFNQNRR